MLFISIISKNTNKAILDYCVNALCKWRRESEDIKKYIRETADEGLKMYEEKQLCHSILLSEFFESFKFKTMIWTYVLQTCHVLAGYEWAIIDFRTDSFYSLP